MNDTLMSAVATGDSELVKILLSKKWDLKATGDSFSTDSNSDTLYIMSKKDEDVCRFRKYPLASSLKGATVLDLALWNGDEKIAKLLKEKGAITKIDPVKVNSEQAGELPPCTDAQKKLALRAQQID
jgi:ankyrin repeat protein